ncbi:MAG: hypothetical protein ACLTTH_06820 [Holdemanella porci]
MMGYEEILNSYKFVTTNAAKTLHLGDSYGIQEGNPASLVVMDAKNYHEALNLDAPVLKSYKDGKLIASCTHRQHEKFYFKRSLWTFLSLA